MHVGDGDPSNTPASSLCSQYVLRSRMLTDSNTILYTLIMYVQLQLQLSTLFIQSTEYNTIASNKCDLQHFQSRVCTTPVSHASKLEAFEFFPFLE